MTQQNATIRFFEGLAKRGYGGFIRLRSAIPDAEANHKRPVLNDWTNPENWFSSYQEASDGGRFGVGFALKDLIVVDVDEPSENFDPEVYGTPYGITPNGGYHLLFAKPKGCSLRGATKLNTSLGVVDIRTDGNQIVITQPLYKWRNLGAVKTLPEGLQHQLEVASGLAGQTVKDYFKRFAAGEVFGEGERNTALYRLAIGFLSLYRKLRGEDPTDEEWETLCEWLNDTAVDEPEENFAKYYNRYLRYNTDNFYLDRFLTSDRVRYGLKLMGIDAVAHSHNAKQAGGAKEGAVNGGEPPNLLRLSFEDVLHYEQKAVWVLDGVLPEGSLALISAQPSVGKSTFLRQMAVCIAGGLPFLGIQTRPRPVIYYSNDEHPTFIGMHLKQLRPHITPEAEQGVQFWVGNLTLEQFIQQLSPYRDAVVIVDVVGRWFEDLRDYNAVSKVMGRLRDLASNQNLTLILAHHAPRSENRALGVAAIDGAVDVEFRLYREGGQRFLDIDKRTLKKAFGLPLKMQDGWLTVDRKDNIALLKAIEEVFEDTHDDYIWFDRIPAEHIPAVNMLIAKGYIKLKVSQKGSPYIQLRNLNLQDIKRRILEADQQYLSLIKPTQQEAQDENAADLLEDRKRHASTDNDGGSRVAADVDAERPSTPDSGRDIYAEVPEFEADGEPAEADASFLEVWDDGERFDDVDADDGTYGDDGVPEVGGADGGAQFDRENANATAVEGGQPMSWFDKTVERLSERLKKTGMDCLERFRPLRKIYDDALDFFGCLPQDGKELMRLMDALFTDEEVVGRGFAKHYKYLKACFFRRKWCWIIDRKSGAKVDVKEMDEDMRTMFLFYYSRWSWLEHLYLNGWLVDGIDAANFHDYAEEVLQ